MISTYQIWIFVVILGCLLGQSHGDNCITPNIIKGFCNAACVNKQQQRCTKVEGDKPQACICETPEPETCKIMLDDRGTCGSNCTGIGYTGGLCQQESLKKYCVCYKPESNEEQDQFPSILQRLLNALRKVFKSYGNY